MRLLGAIRLSRHRGEADPSTSPERQTSAIAATAEREAGEIVGWARDLDVSAVVHAPFARPELGDWLNNRASEYDGIVWARFDRAVRSMTDMHDLAKWAAEHRKTLIFAVGPGGGPLRLDFRSGPLDPWTQFQVTTFAFAAQMEAYVITERNRDTRAFMRSVGRWSGGMYPYHTMPERDGNGWRLVKNPETWEVMEEILDRVMNRESKRSVADSLNWRGIPSPREYRMIVANKIPVAPADGSITKITEEILTIKPIDGGQDIMVRKFPKHVDWCVSAGDQLVKDQRLTKRILWSGKIIGDMLRAQALLGVVEFEKKAVLSEDGMPVKRCPAIVNRDEWARLQAILVADGAANSKSNTADASQLNGIAFCGVCGEPRYFRRQKTISKGKTFEYANYGCRSNWGYLMGQKKEERCTDKSVRAADLEAAVEEAIIRYVGKMPQVVQEHHAGESHREEMAEATAALKDIIERTAGKSAAVQAIYAEQIKSLENRITRLAEMPEVAPHVEWMPTGKTYQEAWEAADEAGRRKLLLDSGIRVEVVRADTEDAVGVAMRAAYDRGKGKEFPAMHIVTVGNAVAAVTFPRDLFNRAIGRGSWTDAYRKEVKELAEKIQPID